MLRLQNIKKTYVMEGGTDVAALKGVSIRFRKNEFVSILGPSGCGKTTLLNIIGGLDHPSDGSMSIGGVPTADFDDRDWDTYRNHSIGFVFQTYNLIPHMSVLANVEMAPIISGVSKAERRKNAIAALEKVGLGDQLHKKPNQLSGGQMQRVAIARALVNNPEIVLADEPTGALDTETSVQIMEILKEISKDRLIIMVTHNPELAEQYSSRIVRLKDGLIEGDTDPYDVAEYDSAPQRISKKEKKQKGKESKKASMSFFTALSLSTRNLLTKKGRALLTSFAGSIGIIGIALILALSTGVQAYVDKVQEDTLSSYPLTINAQVSDTSAIADAMLNISSSDTGNRDENTIYTDDTVGNLISAMRKVKTNDLPTFIDYFEKHKSELNGSLNAYQIIYDISIPIYTTLENGNIMQVNPTSIFSYMGESFNSMMSGMMALTGSGNKITYIKEMLSGLNGELINPIIKDQFELVGEESRWPTKSNEVLLVVNENNSISNMALYGLGFKDPERIEGIMSELLKPNGEYTPDNINFKVSEIVGHTYRYVMNTDYYRARPLKEGSYTVDGKVYPIWEDVRNRPDYDEKKFLEENGREMVIVGIIRNLPDATATSISSPLAYTGKLTEEVLEYNSNSAIAKQQLETPDYDVFSGAKFEEKNFSPKDAAEFVALLSSAQKSTLISQYNQLLNSMVNSESIPEFLAQLDPAGFASVVKMVLPPYTKQTVLDFISSVSAVSQNKQMLVGALSMLYPDITDWSKDETLAIVLLSMDQLTFKSFVAQFSPEPPQYTKDQIDAFLADIGSEGIADLVSTIKEAFKLTEYNMVDRLSQMNEKSFAEITKGILSTSSGIDINLGKMGFKGDHQISSVALYATNFAGKDKISEFIDNYNQYISSEKGEEYQVEVTDFMGSLMSWVSTVVDVISWVLIAFVSISLIVSSIMIAIITYISVLERTKEIGILRSLGASKRNIRYVFNAETLIEGFCAGLLGVLVTYGLCALINPIIHALAGVDTVSAILPWNSALVLIGISMLLTLVAGLIPAQMASKKDPVIALRTE